MPAIFRQLLAQLAIMALAVAQLTGLSGGWVCDCSGEPVAVIEQWCHGAECHQDHPAEDHDHEHEHHEVRDDLKTVAAAPLQFTAPALAEWLPPMPLPQIVSPARTLYIYAPTPRLEDPGGGRRQENYARRTAVLLI